MVEFYIHLTISFNSHSSGHTENVSVSKLKHVGTCTSYRTTVPPLNPAGMAILCNPKQSLIQVRHTTRHYQYKAKILPIPIAMDEISFFWFKAALLT